MGNAQRTIEHPINHEAVSLELATNQAIEACDGDMRGAIQALLIANEYLEQRNRELAAFVSVGFVRGQYPPSNAFEDSLSAELDVEGRQGSKG